MKLKKCITAIMLTAAIVGSTVPAYAEENLYESDTIQESISELAEAYSVYYDISNIETTLLFSDEKDGYVENNYMIDMNAVLKVNSVDEMDYYQGVVDYCDAYVSINAQLSDEVTVYNDMLAVEQEVIYNELSEYIGEEQDLIFFIMEKYSKESPENKEILFENGDDYVSLNEMLPLSREQLRQYGYENMENIAASLNDDVSQPTRSYSYSVSDAVSYMTKYTSNPTSCNACGNSSCGYYVNTAKYNSSYTNYASSHSDCANYVSQALSNGGIPEDSTWKPYTSSWISVSNLTTYMTSNGYWSSVTYSVLQKGDIIKYKSSSHVAMVTSFDGTTYKYSAHTNDRLNVTFTPTSSLAYYYRVG